VWSQVPRNSDSATADGLHNSPRGISGSADDDVMVLAQTPDGSEFGLNSDADVDVNAAADDDASAPLLETNTEAKYLLVIEKQGIFLRLCEDSFHL